MSRGVVSLAALRELAPISFVTSHMRPVSRAACNSSRLLQKTAAYVARFHCVVAVAGHGDGGRARRNLVFLKHNFNVQFIITNPQTLKNSVVA